MYKIYINDTPLFLLSAEEHRDWPDPDETHLVAPYPGKAKFLLNYIDMLEKSDRFETVALYSRDYDQLVRDFKNHFTKIGAAGGLVFNSDSELLFIFRRGFWDLPKGKIDEGESVEEAALREVREETGLHQVDLGEKIGNTYHTYRDKKGTRILKRTHWFAMSTEERELVPEEKEDIEIATWMKISDFFAEERKVYGNIQDLLKKVAK